MDVLLHDMPNDIDTKIQYTYITKAFDKNLFKILADLNAFVAGGAISCLFTNRQINDFDIYFQKEDDEKQVISYLKTTSNWKHEFSSSLSDTYANENMNFSDTKEYGKTLIINNAKLQLVNSFHGDYKTIFNTFDFHCCMGAFLFKQNEFVFDKYFITDNMSRNIRFNYEGCVNALSTFVRLDKYKAYGYTASLEELIKIIFCIKKTKLDTMDDLKKFIKLLPTGPYKKILIHELFDKPTEAILRKHRNDELVTTSEYHNFKNSPCNLDDVVSIMCDLDSYIEPAFDQISILPQIT